MYSFISLYTMRPKTNKLCMNTGEQTMQGWSLKKTFKHIWALEPKSQGKALEREGDQGLRWFVKICTWFIAMCMGVNTDLKLIRQNGWKAELVIWCTIKLVPRSGHHVFIWFTNMSSIFVARHASSNVQPCLNLIYSA